MRFYFSFFSLILMLVDIVVGCSYGGEGKGKVIYDLLKNEEYNLCIKFNGSSDIKHTIYYNNTKIYLYQLPIGILTNNINLISSDCLININKLKEEIEYIKSLGIDIKDRLMISKACHIIQEDNINTAFANKMLRINKRVEDYSDVITEMGIKIVNMRNFWIENNFERVLIQGSHSFELDINWTDNYPNCTSSTCTLAGAINTGIPLYTINNIYGISKCYDTYDGNITFQSEDPNLDKIAEYEKEFESINGRKRQCNYLNLNKLNDALRINECSLCIMNKIDILENLKIFKLYYNNELLTFNTIDEMKEFIDKNTKVYIIYSSNPYII